jgi:hypothetical protein
MLKGRVNAVKELHIDGLKSPVGTDAAPDTLGSTISTDASFPFNEATIEVVTAQRARELLATRILPKFPSIKQAFVHADTLGEGSLRCVLWALPSRARALLSPLCGRCTCLASRLCP